jgi:hypothetical protein
MTFTETTQPITRYQVTTLHSKLTSCGHTTNKPIPFVYNLEEARGQLRCSRCDKTGSPTQYDPYPDVSLRAVGLQGCGGLLHTHNPIWRLAILANVFVTLICFS